MKNGDFYYHFKQGNEYFFDCIALPLNEFRGNRSLLEKSNLAFDAHTPDGEEPRRVQLYWYQGVTFIDRDVAHVVYQAEKDYDTDNVWVRKPDDFFGYVKNPKDPNGDWIKRFEKRTNRN